MQIIFSWFLLLAILSSPTLAESSTFLQAKPGCQTKCGNITIPFPFGIGDGCFINPAVVGGHSGYDINCNTSYDPPKPFIRKGSLEILNISETEIRIRNDRIASLCYDESGSPVPGATFRDLNLVGSVFTISYTKNSFYGIGCDIMARIEWGSSGGRQPITSTNSSCEPKCKSRENMMEGSCTGTSGCCQTTFPKNLQNVSVEVLGRSPVNGLISSPNSCNFAYLAEQGQYPSQASELLPDGGLHAGTKVIPAVLDWAIGDTSCEEAKANSTIYTCFSNSDCTDAVNNLGYHCTCRKGYGGNPYLEPGCEDINECEDRTNNPCIGNCINTDGGYNCSCPHGSDGDGRKDGTGCTNSKQNFPVVGAALGILLIFASSSSAAVLVQTKPGCQSKCGNVSIPYPFGIGEGCSLDTSIYGLGYNVMCDTSYDPPKPLFMYISAIGSGAEMFSISDTEISVRSSISENCYRKTYADNTVNASAYESPFMVSHTKNRVFAVGCNSSVFAIMQLYGTRMNSNATCHSQCETWKDVVEGSCTGSGCCSTTIPKGVYSMFGLVRSNQTEVWPFNPCSYAFVAETDRFKFSASDLVDINRKGRDDISMVVDWAIGMETCIEAQKHTSTYMCQGNSSCADPVNSPGYRCVCHQGYEGNPYLKPGCQGT
ncbi:hypothetical protein MKW92_030910 [Papaver armeniacum]|nr:hypothetical protein MKW92_030910 [Papaver armeniacum]